jgi:hypothetical protein
MRMTRSRAGLLRLESQSQMKVEHPPPRNGPGPGRAGSAGLGRLCVSRRIRGVTFVTSDGKDVEIAWERRSV